jgi:peroxin-14
MSSQVDEDKIQNAITFLRHPKVRGSTDESKRSFLSSKGLTDAEVNEAFRRAEDGATGPSTPSDSSRVAQMQVSAPSAQIAELAHPARASPPPLSWTNVLLGIGFAGAAVYSIKSIFGPSISRTYDTLKSSLRSSKSAENRNETEDTGDGVGDTCRVHADPDEDQRAAVDSSKQLVAAIRDQTEQLRLSMEQLIRSSTAGNESISELREEVRGLAGKLDGSRSSGGDESAPMSYMQVLEMLEQGRPIPGIRDDIDDKPPKPDLSPTVSRMETKTKPWEEGRAGEMAGSSGTTPSRRDLSGERPSGSIFESVTRTPEKHQAVIVEQEGAEDRRSPWRPPPMPMASLSE